MNRNSYSRLLVSCLVATSLAGAAVAQTPSCRLSDLGWMAGIWREQHDARVTEERWTPGLNGRLMGSSWTLHSDTAAGFIEAMEIASDASGVSLRIRHFDATLEHAREDRDAPMVFTAGACARRSATFNGQGAQAGEKITYLRSGDHLNFIGDFIHAGQPVQATVNFVRTGE